MEEFKVLHGLENNLPIDRDENTLYHTTDGDNLYIGKTRYVKEIEHQDHETRISQIESENGGLTNNLKKSLVQYYRFLSDKDSTQKTYLSNIIRSVKDMEDYAKMGTGLFIHWGVYSVPAGHYEGINSRGVSVNKNISYNTEWSMRDLGIPKNIYKNYELQFTGENFDAEELVKKVKACGMKYIILTAKHHEGFSLYPTSYGGWDIRTSACRNTIMDELKTACDAYDIKLCLYYSQYWDWMYEGGFGLDHGKKWCDTDPYTEEQHMEYCEKATKQIDEMIRKFDPYVLWYDPGTSYDSKYVNMFVNAEKENYPQIITNDRLDYNRTYGDFGTGERTIYVRNKLPYGESCFTLNDTWGYSVNNDNKYFSAEKVFKQFLLYTLSYGQNCVLNVGPKPDGSIPQAQIDMLGNVETFIKKYGNFYGYKQINKVSRPRWGYMIQMPNNIVMCYVITKNNENYSEILLDSINTKFLTEVEILTPGGVPSYEINDYGIQLHDLNLDTTTKVGVVKLTYSSEPLLEDANYLKENEFLPSNTIVMKSGLSYDFTNLIYNIKPSAKLNHTTEIIWKGTTETFNCVLDFDTTITDDTITVSVKDLETSATTIITYTNDSRTSEDTVELINGKRYEITIKFNSSTTSTIPFNGLTFVPQTIIVHPTSVSLNKTNLSLYEGETEQLIATVLPEDANNKNVTWSIDHENIATINNGLVSALSVGDATITVTTEDGGLIATCVLIVTSDEPDIPPTGITLNKTELTTHIGESVELIATVLPNNATHQAVTWSSSDDNIVLVDSTGKLTPIALGNATITVTTVEGGLTASCDVTVSVVSVDGVTLNKTKIVLTPGKSEQLSAIISPENADNKNVTWTLDDTDIVDMENGLIFAKTSGTTNVTVTTEDGGFTATCEIEVVDETYDYLFEAESLDGTDGQGESTDITPFADDMTNWTLFGYAHNAYCPTGDTNATLVGAFMDSSPWNGFRIDADNNNYPKTGTTNASLIPRINITGNNYINTIDGSNQSTKPKVDSSAEKHPFWLSRNEGVYKYSIDGINWINIVVTQDGINTVKNAKMTVGFDFKRSGGVRTAEKYRFLKTDRPCCVAMKNESEYPFYTLKHKYDRTLTTD